MFNCVRTSSRRDGLSKKIFDDLSLLLKFEVNIKLYCAKFAQLFSTARISKVSLAAFFSFPSVLMRSSVSPSFSTFDADFLPRIFYLLSFGLISLRNLSYRDGERRRRRIVIRHCPLFSAIFPQFPFAQDSYTALLRRFSFLRGHLSKKTGENVIPFFQNATLMYLEMGKYKTIVTTSTQADTDRARKMRADIYRVASRSRKCDINVENVCIRRY